MKVEAAELIVRPQAQVSAAPDGRAVGYTSTDRRLRLVRLHYEQRGANSSGGAMPLLRASPPVVIAHGTTNLGSSFSWDPPQQQLSWSPDSRWLAFVAHAPNTPGLLLSATGGVSLIRAN